jgi:hypothetical protein
MVNLAPLQRRNMTNSRSSPSRAKASDARRGMNAPPSISDREVLADDSANDPSATANGFSFSDIVLSLIHGLALLFLSFWALYHFGQVFWFFSIVMTGLGMNSLHDGFSAFRRSQT